MIACMAAFLQHAQRLETSVFFQLSGTQIVSQAEPIVIAGSMRTFVVNFATYTVLFRLPLSNSGTICKYSSLKHSTPGPRIMLFLGLGKIHIK